MREVSGLVKVTRYLQKVLHKVKFFPLQYLLNSLIQGVGMFNCRIQNVAYFTLDKLLRPVSKVPSRQCLDWLQLSEIVVRISSPCWANPNWWNNFSLHLVTLLSKARYYCSLFFFVLFCLWCKVIFDIHWAECCFFPHNVRLEHSCLLNPIMYNMYKKNSEVVHHHIFARSL